MSDGRIQVVERAVDVLRVLARGPASLTEVAQATGLPKGTAFRILGSLRYEDMVVKDPLDNRYMLGTGFLRLTRNPLQGLAAVAALARPALTEVWRSTEETITLHARLGPDRVCVEELQSPHPIRYMAGVGVRAPLHVGSAGKVLLAFMPADERERILRRVPLEPMTPRTIVDAEALVAELDEVRARGWAGSAGERVPNAAAISVPVRVREDLVLALSILGPADRLTEDRQMAALDDLRAAAAAIEAATGGTPDLDGEYGTTSKLR